MLPRLIAALFVACALAACGMPEATTAAATAGAAKAVEAKNAQGATDKAKLRVEQALQEGAAQREAAVSRQP